VGNYIINQLPTIRDEDGSLLVFTEVRVCLGCARIAPAEAYRCPYCQNLQHTRTVLISRVATVDGRPKVTIKNFGND
jgi:hypothetical protein